MFCVSRWAFKTIVCVLHLFCCSIEVDDALKSTVSYFLNCNTNYLKRFTVFWLTNVSKFRSWCLQHHQEVLNVYDHWALRLRCQRHCHATMMNKATCTWEYFTCHLTVHCCIQTAATWNSIIQGGSHTSVLCTETAEFFLTTYDEVGHWRPVLLLVLLSPK